MSMVLSELCGEVNNYFDRDLPKYGGEFTIEDGILTDADSLGLQIGQYYRILGSVFNDGVHQWTGEPDNDLTDEVFEGDVHLLAVPKEFADLAKEIGAWIEKYGEASMSPLASESLAPTSYSYSVNTGAGSGAVATWQNIFSSRLTRWRKIRP